MEPSVAGMVQDQGAAIIEERLERVTPQTKRDDSNDIWYVKNIDENCSEYSWDTIRITEKWKDNSEEGRGRMVTRFRDITSKYDHAQGFTVKWSNQPITIKPGEVKRLPKYIADHYVQKLLDHMLDKRGPEKMLRNDPIVRPEVESKIIVKKEAFIADMPQTVGAQTLADIEALNPPTNPYINDEGKSYDTKGQSSIELGEDTAEAKDMIPTDTGQLRTAEIEPTESVINRLGSEDGEDNSTIKTAWQGTSKVDIIKLIRDMTPDYKFGSNMTKAQLISILEKNY